MNNQETTIDHIGEPKEYPFIVFSYMVGTQTYNTMSSVTMTHEFVYKSKFKEYFPA